MRARKPMKTWWKLRKPKEERGAKRLLKDTHGAVYVEFLSAFLPMLIFFFSLIQLVFVHTAALVVSHAALIGARKAATVLPEDPAYMPGTMNSYAGHRKDLIDEAIKYPLNALGNPEDAQITVAGPGAYNGIITVTVTYPFQCRVPAGQILCGGATKDLTAIAPHAQPGR